MSKTTYLKFLFLLSLFCFGVSTAQVRSDKKELQFPKKSIEQRSKSHGYDRCSTVEYEKYLKSKFPERMTTEQFEAWLAPLIEKEQAKKSQSGGIITIPVVVHVIHSGQDLGVAPNITDAQVMSQITVMNNDYRRITGTPGFNSNPVGADVQIQFALAKVDPNGNPTNGIDRVNLCQDNWSVDDIDDIVKPQTIWDPTKYMNMWSVSFADAGLLGYAQFPSSSGLSGLNLSGGIANTDGVVANFATFGSIAYNDGTFLLSAPYNRGRTMTHEVGHFLGLRHIWGDDNDATVCATDYCNDTPPAHQDNYNCDAPIASCTVGLNEMVENYMDYTEDLCMNIFTNDQKTRITTVMNNSPRRMELKTSVADQAIPLFANDAEIKIDGGCGTVCGGGKLRLIIYNRGTSNLTSAVISYSFNGGPAQNYNWSGNLAQDKYSVVTIPVLSSVASSPVSATITSANGVVDQRSTNNTVNGNYVKPSTPEYFSSTTYTFKIQRDYYGTETRWTLKNSAGQIVKSGGPYQDVTTFPALITQSWTLPLDCYVFTISDAYGDGLSDGGYVDLSTSTGQVVYHASDNFGSYGTKSFTNQVLATNETNIVKDNFGIYPNPANDVLNITKVSNKATFEIHNAVGQLIKSGNIDNNQVRVSELVKGTYIITIKDKDVTESIKFIKK